MAKKPSETGVKPVAKPASADAKLPAKPPEVPAKQPVAKAPEKPATLPAPPKPPAPAAKSPGTATPAAARPGLTVIPLKPTAPPKPPKKSNDDDDDALGSLFSDPPPVTSGPVSLNTRAFAELMAAEKAELPTEAPVDQRMIKMTCAMCDHVWDVGFDKQGKNAPCPECRHINKVPEQKQKSDWREANAKKPSLAKQEKLEGVVDTTEVGFVSGQALREGGAIEELIEPRPKWHYVALVGSILFVLVGGYLGISTVRQDRIESKQDSLVAEAQKDLLEAPDTALPTPEAPLFRAAFHLAAGEYAIRSADAAHPEKLTEARGHFDSARQELASAPKSGARDALFAELLADQVLLGGNDEEVLSQTRVRWSPRDSSTARVRIRTDDFDVQSELRRTLTAMKREDRPADLEFRAAAVRRLTRELCQAKQADVITGIFSQGFFEGELAEISGEVGLELLRAGEKEHARTIAEQVKSLVRPPAAPPPSAFALWKSVEPPISGPTLPNPGEKGEVSNEASLLAYTTLALIQGKPEDAVKLAARGGKAESKLRAYALVGEWSANPAEAIKGAGEVVKQSAGKKEIGPLPAGPLVRLIQAAARSGQPDQIDALAAGIPDESLRIWAKADAFRIRAAASPDAKPLEESQLTELPSDPKNLRLGHAWGRLALARNNAKATGSNDFQQYEKWGKSTVAPFAKVGVALGLQDRTR